MKTIRTAFTCAAKGGARFKGLRVYWLMVFAIAIIDDGERRSKRPAPPGVPTP